MEKVVQCWCGETDLSAFSPDYGSCSACGTLVSLTIPAKGLDHVADSEEGLYGRDYWFTHQTEYYGHPTILARARADLSERCLWWLRTILRFKLPPASALEVGCAHGGAVALLDLAGFNAVGVELSPWVVKFARETFDVQVLYGSIETQRWSPGSFDVIALFDVLEHLADPARTIRRCVELLKPDGILVIQTPCVPPDASFEQLSAESGALIRALVPGEHLFLFTETSLKRFLTTVGCSFFAPVPAVFPDVDMFFVASPEPLQPNSEEAVATALSRHPDGRFVQAFLDLYQRSETFERASKDATATVTTLEGEKLALQHERLLLQHESVTLQNQTLALESEKLALQNEKQVLESEKLALRAQIQALQSEIQGLQTQIAILTARQEAFLTSRLGRLQTFQARIRAKVRRAFGVGQP